MSSIRRKILKAVAFILAVCLGTIAARLLIERKLYGTPLTEGLIKAEPKQDERVYSHSVWIGNSEVQVWILTEK